MTQTDTVVVTLAIALSLPAARPAAQNPAAPQTGVIVGVVVDGETNRPLGGAQVTLFNAGAARQSVLVQQALVVSSEASFIATVIGDAEGRFVFRGLAAHSYSVIAQLSGHTLGAFGRMRPDGPDRTLPLASGERRTDVVIPLWRFGTIAGRVLDEAGEPVVGVTVRAFRRATTSGRPRLDASVRADDTDDRGVYRISRLLPADYVVAVVSTTTSLPFASVEATSAVATSDAAARSASLRSSRETGAPQIASEGVRVGDLIQSGSSEWTRLPALSPSADGRVSVYPTTYHPDAPTASQARVVSIRSGETRAAIDIQLEPARAVRVSGILMGPDGPAAAHGVRLVAAPSESELQFETAPEDARTTTSGDGRFALLVPMGRYVLKAYRIPLPAVGVRGAGPPVTPSQPGPSGSASTLPATLWAEVPLSIGPEGVSDLEVELRPGASIAGQLEFEGGTPRPLTATLERLAVSAMPLFSSVPTAVGAVRPNGEGVFTTRGYPPGRYVLVVASPGPQWTLKSIVAAGENAAMHGLALDRTDLSGVVVTFTDRLTELSGIVQAPTAGARAVDATVVAVPADHREALAAGLLTRRSATVRTEPDGTYRLRMPFPGDYLVVAVPADIAPDLDERFLVTFASRGTRVSVAEGERKTLPLSVSRAQ